jgi:hypothetical protein
MRLKIFKHDALLGIVIHDAGGAEIVTSYIKDATFQFLICAEGPARKIAERKLNPKRFYEMHKVVEASDLILCGTSFTSNLEFNALKKAQSHGKRSISILDHWVNYRLRFLRGEECIYPDEIWVVDKFAKKIAIEELKGPKIKLMENPYFDDLKKEFESYQKLNSIKNDKDSILYLTEPFRAVGQQLYNNPRHWGYTEEEILKYFLSNVALISKECSKLTIRPHPKEDLDKYNWLSDMTDIPLHFDNYSSLSKQIFEHDIIIGCATMAMVVGLLGNKRVISCIPPKAKISPLPHPDIELLQNIVSNHELR